MSERPQPEQLSFLSPDDVELLTMMRRFMAEASRLYEARSGRPLEDPMIIRSPADIHELLRTEMGELEQEQLRTITVGTRLQVLSTRLLYQGTVNSTTVRIGEIFRPAILDNATGLFVVHNHPSGDPDPSHPHANEESDHFITVGREPDEKGGLRYLYDPYPRTGSQIIYLDAEDRETRGFTSMT